MMTPLLPDKPKPSLPKRIERNFAALFKLGRTEALVKRLVRAIKIVEPEVNSLRTDLEGQGAALAVLRSDHDGQVQRLDVRIDDERRGADERMNAGLQSASERLEQQQETFTALRSEIDRLEGELRHEGGARQAVRRDTTFAIHHMARRLDAMQSATLHRSASRPNDSGAISDDLAEFLDGFYRRFEDRYRGPEAEIARRLSAYLPDIRAAQDRTGPLPALDLGCGRGEWLSILRDAGVDAWGVDTNAAQIETASGAGLDARLGDAIAAIEEAEPESLSIVSAHHLIEHLPFGTVARVTRAAFRALAPGGLLLFETPNTTNVLVGATTFHTDPTHIKPMPQQVLHVLLETAGFDPVEMRPLNPHERLDEFRQRPGFDDELAVLLFGPQDLAALGIKPEPGQP